MVRKLSAYQVAKLIRSGTADLADIHQDMILASIVTPKVSREDVQQFDEETYYGLVTELEKLNEKAILALGNYMTSSTRSHARSKTN